MDHIGDELAQDGLRASASRLRVLRSLAQVPEGQGVQDLAVRVGLHVNTVRLHLDYLVTEGMVTRHSQERSGPGRPRLTFTAVARPPQGHKRSYRLLAEILAGFVAATTPDVAAVATGVGRSWGQYLTERPAPYRVTGDEESLTELVRILDEIGFGPEVVAFEQRRELRLRRCPFLEVAQVHREVVCAIHLGLMQGALAEMRAPFTADSLDPWVEPSLCVATLSKHLPGTGDAG